MTRRLPLLAERALADTKATQMQAASEYEHELRGDSTISCRTGCANCCHHPFLVTVLEGLLLYRFLASHGKWTPSLRKQVHEARDKTLGLAFEVWLLSNIPCPLLDTRMKCTAYEARPVHCRTTFSVGDPELCHPHKLGTNTPLADNTSVIVGFNIRVQELLKKLGSHGRLMPLSEALLLAEAIDNDTLSIEASDIQYIHDLLR